MWLLHAILRLSALVDATGISEACAVQPSSHIPTHLALLDNLFVFKLAGQEWATLSQLGLCQTRSLGSTTHNVKATTRSGFGAWVSELTVGHARGGSFVLGRLGWNLRLKLIHG